MLSRIFGAFPIPAGFNLQDKALELQMLKGELDKKVDQIFDLKCGKQQPYDEAKLKQLGAEHRSILQDITILNWQLTVVQLDEQTSTVGASVKNYIENVVAELHVSRLSRRQAEMLTMIKTERAQLCKLRAELTADGTKTGPEEFTDYDTSVLCDLDDKKIAQWIKTFLTPREYDMLLVLDYERAEINKLREAPTTETILEEELVQVTAVLRTKEDELYEAQQSIIRKENAIQDAHSIIHEKEVEITDLKDRLFAKTDELSKKTQELEDALHTVSSQAAKLRDCDNISLSVQNALTAVTAEQRSMKHTLEEHHNKLEAAEHATMAKEAEYHHIQTSVFANQHKLDKLAQKIDALEKELQGGRDITTTMSDTLVSVEAKLAEQTKQLQDVGNIVQRFETAVTAKTKVFDAEETLLDLFETFPRQGVMSAEPVYVHRQGTDIDIRNLDHENHDKEDTDTQNAAEEEGRDEKPVNKIEENADLQEVDMKDGAVVYMGQGFQKKCDEAHKDKSAHGVRIPCDDARSDEAHGEAFCNAVAESECVVEPEQNVDLGDHIAEQDFEIVNSSDSDECFTPASMGDDEDGL